MGFFNLQFLDKLVGFLPKKARFAVSPATAVSSTKISTRARKLSKNAKDLFVSLRETTRIIMRLKNTPTTPTRIRIAHKI